MALFTDKKQHVLSLISLSLSLFHSLHPSLSLRLSRSLSALFSPKTTENTWTVYAPFLTPDDHVKKARIGRSAAIAIQNQVYEESVLRTWRTSHNNSLVVVGEAGCSVVSTGTPIRVVCSTPAAVAVHKTDEKPKNIAKMKEVQCFRYIPYHSYMCSFFSRRFCCKVSGGGQADHDRTGMMSSGSIPRKWASAGTRLKRLRRTGGAGWIVSLTRDEPGTAVINLIDSSVHCPLKKTNTNLKVCVRFTLFPPLSLGFNFPSENLWKCVLVASNQQCEEAIICTLCMLNMLNVTLLCAFYIVSWIRCS